MATQTFGAQFDNTYRQFPARFSPPTALVQRNYAQNPFGPNPVNFQSQEPIVNNAGGPKKPYDFERD